MCCGLSRFDSVRILTNSREMGMGMLSVKAMQTAMEMQTATATQTATVKALELLGESHHWSIARLLLFVLDSCWLVAVLLSNWFDTRTIACEFEEFAPQV